MKQSVTIILPLAAALLWSGPLQAQDPAMGPSPERIKQVIVYGNDPCPVSSGDEIVVCARQEEAERYRIPEELRRGEPGTTKNEAWTSRVKSIEYVGRSGTQSCSPVGGGGFTGCFEQIARDAKAERKQFGSASWADLVAAERAKRLSTIDEDSEEIEARVKAEEAARKKAEATTEAEAAVDSAAEDHGETK